jgi:hypothetical protein
MKTLGILLGASVLFNIALLARGPGAAPEPARRPAPPSRQAVVPPPSPDVADPAETAALKVRVRELETEKAARADVAPAASGRASFREKLARVMKLWRDPRALMNAAPEAQLELQEVALEFQRAKVDRWKDPRAYTETLGALLEQTAIETKKPLSDGQREALRRTLDEYATSLAGQENAGAWERFLRESGPEADFLQRLRAFVSPEQEAKVMAFGGLSPWAASTAPWVDRNQAEIHVVQTWTQAYGLEESQKPAVAAAARVYLDAVNAFNAQMGKAALPGRETPEWRRRTAEILIDALGTLESSLTPEQRERLRSRRPAEVRVYDAAALSRP